MPPSPFGSSPHFTPLFDGLVRPAVGVAAFFAGARLAGAADFFGVADFFAALFAAFFAAGRAADGAADFFFAGVCLGGAAMRGVSFGAGDAAFGAP